MENSARQRGSVLVLAIILLAVLSFIGISAIILSSQGRQNASAQSRYDILVQCANAAQGQLWSEVAAYGSGFLKSGITLGSIGQLTLPDGTQMVAPAHYGQAPGTTPTVAVNQVVLVEPDAVAATSGDSDMTNQDRSAKVGGTYRAVATCSDQKGRTYEVEFSVHLAL